MAPSRLLLGLLLGTCLLALSPPPASAHQKKESTKEPVEEIEEVEPVRPVSGRATHEKQRGGPLDLLGKLHPMLIHLPIAWILLLVAVDGLTFIARRERWSRTGWLLLAAVVVSLVPVIVTGLLREEHVEVGATRELLRRLDLHETMGLILGGLSASALALRTVRRNRLRGAWAATYLLLVIGMAAVMTLTAHFGGKLVFGEDYLPF